MNAANQQQFYFRLQIDQQQILRYYQGTASQVQVISECGRRLQFPAMRLRPFLTQNGISGRFRLTIDADNRFVKLKKIS
ncbi:MAG TPA: DUF2835 domain-containing protein [Malonomonas sp.]